MKTEPPELPDVIGPTIVDVPSDMPRFLDSATDRQHEYMRKRGALTRIGDSIARRGAWRTFVACASFAWDAARAMSARFRPARILDRYNDRAFDRRFGIETSEHVGLGELDIDPGSDALSFANIYQASSIRVFRRIMRGLDLEFSNFVFVDFGAGKGRCLLMAAQYPFRRVIGVEFSPKLVEQARNNVRTAAAGRLPCRQVEVVCTDAVEFAIPDDPAVFYFFNPFTEKRMARVVDNIVASLGRSRREAYVVYLAPTCAHVFENRDCFAMAASEGDESNLGRMYRVYRYERR